MTPAGSADEDPVALAGGVAAIRAGRPATNLHSAGKSQPGQPGNTPAGRKFQTAGALALNDPVVAERSPDQEAAVLAALQGLYRDFLQARLESSGAWSVDHASRGLVEG